MNKIGICIECGRRARGVPARIGMVLCAGCIRQHQQRTRAGGRFRNRRSPRERQAARSRGREVDAYIV